MNHRKRTSASAGAAIAIILLGYALGPISFAQKKAVKPKSTPLSADRRLVLDRITANSLRGHLSFLASDALEGRNTPSRGLDTAADYIAAQFRRAALEPVGRDGYFQTTTWAEAAALSRRAIQITPEEGALKVRNVAGILRGSDPILKDTYVIISAHYDHVGIRQSENAVDDKIFNGANDDGSGTVSVIEIASALSTIKVRPRRSILFLTFFGEEKGLLGSRFYGKNPLVPLEKTVAQLNLEHMGRTDDSEGPQIGTVAMTGFDYSDLGTVLTLAGTLTGIKAYKHPKNSDAFFGRSDNQALADLGIPAHTLSVAYLFPDYHGAGDHWEKVDFDNMARVDRAVALTLMLIADSAQAPAWNTVNPSTAKYVEASRKLKGGQE